MLWFACHPASDFLVMHLSELVKTSFIAATASVDHLKLEGYKALQVNTQVYTRLIESLNRLLLTSGCYQTVFRDSRP